MKKYFITGMLLIVVFYKTYSQDAPCRICAEALKRQTTDEFFKEKRSSVDESIGILYSYDYEFWERYNSSSGKTSSLSAAYSIFSASFGQSSNSSENKETFNKQKSAYTYSRSLAQSDYEKISRVLVNKTPYQTFDSCIKACFGSNGVIISSVSSGDDIIVTARFVIVNGSPNQETTLKSMSVSNAAAVDYNFKRELKLKANNSISGLFKRADPMQKVLISFDFENYPTIPVEIKAGKFQNAELPVGSIVYSALDYPNFLALNGISDSEENSEITWVPADGRNVLGSVYAKIQTAVPDLRGVFLRGLNVFDQMNNPVLQHPEQIDSTFPNRLPNVLQLQDIKSHDHQITDPGHSHIIVLHSTDGDGGIGWCGRDSGPSKRDHGSEAARTGINKTEFTGGGETRPTNVALFVYIKIN